MDNAFDSTNYPECVPQRLARGGRWAWKDSRILTPYPSASYSWRWVARPEKGADAQLGEVSIAGSASGSAVLFEEASATTAAYVAGRYIWQLQVTRTSDSEVVTVDSGIVTVTPDADETTGDHRSHARRVLDVLERAIEGNTSPEVQSYSVGGRSISRYSREELMQFRQRYRREVDAEHRRNAGSGGRRVRARFVA